MRLGTLLVALFVATCVFSEVTCITNQEFFDLVKGNVEDLESFDIDDPAVNDDDDDDSNVIELPGNADEELDIECLMTKLDLADVMENIEESAPMKTNNNLGWWNSNKRPSYRRSGRRRSGHRRSGRRRSSRRRYGRRRSGRRRGGRRRSGRRRSGRRQWGRRRSGRGRRRNRQTHLQNPCSCSGSSSSCCLNHKFQINMWNKKWRFLVNGDNVMNLLERLETTVENKETDQLEEISLSDLPILNSQLQTETTEKYLDDESQSENEDSDDLFF